MTAVTEPKKKTKKSHVETLDNGTIVVTDETATDGQEALSPPKPGEPGFDWQTEYPGEKVFVYTSEDGVVVGLAAISEKRQPTIGFLRHTRKQPEFEQVLDMVEFITCPKAMVLVDKWVPTDLIALFEQWSEWNKSNAGE